MMKPRYQIVHEPTGAILCRDGRFRRRPWYGTFPECRKLYKSIGWAQRRARRDSDLAVARVRWRAEIRNTEIGYAYTVDHADECRTATDYAAYVAACCRGRTTIRGHIVVTPRPL